MSTEQRRGGLQYDYELERCHHVIMFPKLISRAKTNNKALRQKQAVAVIFGEKVRSVVFMEAKR